MNVTCSDCGKSFDLEPIGKRTVFICNSCGGTIEILNRIATGETVVETHRGPFRKGERFGGYLIEERIGSGGMGEVFKATQISMSRTVALKIMKRRFSHDEEFSQRFIREARSAGRLNHPNIIQIYDVGCEEGIYFFSMEYVEGESVEATLTRRGCFTPDEAATVVIEVARALKEAHENGIVHRDIKPENIMITRRGVVKVADFGLARPVGSEEPSLTQPGTAIGTPYYMAPEQVRGAKDLDIRADIYSLGCTFFHLVTGDVPFTGTNTYDILRMHESTPLAFPAASTLPECVRMVIARMMAKEPADRFENPGALIHALENVRQALRDTPAAPVRSGNRLKKVLIVLAAAAVLIFLLAVITSGNGRPAVPPEPSEQPAAINAETPVPPAEEPAVNALPRIPALLTVTDLDRLLAAVAAKGSLPQGWNAFIVNMVHANVAAQLGIKAPAFKEAVRQAGPLFFFLEAEQPVLLAEMNGPALEKLFGPSSVLSDIRTYEGHAYFITPDNTVVMRGEDFLMIGPDLAMLHRLAEEDVHAMVRTAAAQTRQRGDTADLVAFGGIDGRFLARRLAAEQVLSAVLKTDALTEVRLEASVHDLGLDASCRIFYGDTQPPFSSASAVPHALLKQSVLPAGAEIYVAAGLPDAELMAGMLKGGTDSPHPFAAPVFRRMITVLQGAGVQFAFAAFYGGKNGTDSSGEAPVFVIEVFPADTLKLIEVLEASDLQCRRLLEGERLGVIPFELSDAEGHMLYGTGVARDTRSRSPDRVYIANTAHVTRRVLNALLAARGPETRKAECFRWPSFQPDEHFIGLGILNKERQAMIRLQRDSAAGVLDLRFTIFD